MNTLDQIIAAQCISFPNILMGLHKWLALRKWTLSSVLYNVYLVKDHITLQERQMVGDWIKSGVKFYQKLLFDLDLSPIHVLGISVPNLMKTWYITMYFFQICITSQGTSMPKWEQSDHVEYEVVSQAEQLLNLASTCREAVA